MAIARTKRGSGAFFLALVLTLWAQLSVAGTLCAPQANRCPIHHTRASAPHSCCPEAVTSLDGEAAQTADAPQFGMHAPCCSLSSSPERPLAYPIAAQDSRLNLQSIGGSGEALDLRLLTGIDLRTSNGDSPPYSRPVFDKKTDLRI